jgi:hypothetical protein
MAHPSSANVSTSRLLTLVNFDHNQKWKSGAACSEIGGTIAADTA